MNALLLTIVLTALALSNAPQQTSTEQPCTGPALVGTWQLEKRGGDAIPVEGPTSLKHVTPTHFFVLSADATGLASYGHGGPYTVSGGKYTESITQGFGAPFTQLLRGMTISFQCSLEKDGWHIVGEIIERRRASFLGTVDLTHPTSPDARPNHVRTDTVSLEASRYAGRVRAEELCARS